MYKSVVRGRRHIGSACMVAHAQSSPAVKSETPIVVAYLGIWNKQENISRCGKKNNLVRFYCEKNNLAMSSWRKKIQPPKIHEKKIWSEKDLPAPPPKIKWWLPYEQL